ncbi:recombination directionality factor [Micromonospora wenchangensis]|uniref:recombination directionality factor n=1 Tax=Micromonospora wenchangensis TaxID=1185415 RepID=UPI003824C7AD
MPIKELQQRLTQVGVIRLGQQLVSKAGKNYPAKLETLRFTSPNEKLIAAVAAKFGGTPRPWASPMGPQFEVITQAREIAVLVPPQTIDPNYELWGNKFRQRMCDGETERIRNQPCLCQPVRAAAAAAGRDPRPGDVCKPTTRLSLMVADIQSLGVWKLESHGWNAAAELPMLASAIRNAPRPIPARLEVQRREKALFHPGRAEKEQIEARVFMVPVLHFDLATPAQAFSGQIGAAVAAAQRELVAQQLAAIEATPAAEGPAGDGTKLTPADVARLAPYTRTVEQLQALWRDAAKDEVLTDEVKALLKKRADDLAKAFTAQTTTPAAPAPQPPAGEPVDAEIEPNKDVLWVQIQAAAGTRQWNAAALEERLYARFKKTSDELTGWDMETFLAEVEKGQIQ